jgi:hypothetical protein
MSLVTRTPLIGLQRSRGKGDLKKEKEIFPESFDQVESSLAIHIFWGVLDQLSLLMTL